MSGVFIAHDLAMRGATVTVIESATVGSAASYGNAGLIVPSYSVPMANPASIMMGLKSLANKEDALKIALRLEPAYLLWLARFVSACRPGKMTASTGVLCDLSTTSMAMYEQLFAAYPETDVGFARTGWLYVYQTGAGLADGLKQAQLVGQCGIPWYQLSAVDVRAREPMLAQDLAGGILYPGDGSVNPYRLVRFIAGLAEKHGVSIRTGVNVRALRVEGRSVRAAVTDHGDIAGNTFVIAAGVLTPQLLRHLSPGFPVQPAKGYSLTFPRTQTHPGMPLNLTEAHVVVSPMRDQVRFTGGLDLVGLDTSLDAARIRDISSAVRSWLPGLEQPMSAERWCGFRPMTPDGIPVIGPLDAADNLVVATGHGTLGITLGPITGRLVGDFISGGSISPQMRPLLPSRFRWLHRSWGTQA